MIVEENIQSGTFSEFSTATEYLCQKPHFKTKSFSELITECTMKFKKEIDGYFQGKVKMSLHILGSFSLQTLKFYRLGQVCKRNWMTATCFCMLCVF